MNPADVLIARAMQLNVQNYVEQRLQNIRQIAAATFLTNIAQRLTREETNQQFWLRIFSQVMGDLLNREADNRSDNLHGGAMIYKRNLTADFMCPNCFKRWDSTQVNVEFHYYAHGTRDGGIRGNIILHETNRQQCSGCVREFDSPIYEESSAVAAATTIKNKLLEKFYNETGMNTVEREERTRRERRRAHMENYCEGCIEGICERGSVMSARAGAPPETPYDPTILLRPVPIDWSLTVNGITSNLR